MATVPGPPEQPTVTRVDSTSIRVTFVDGDSGGAPIDSRQVSYGTDPSTPQFTVEYVTGATITGLTPGVSYYFWARTHNLFGFSGYSPRSFAIKTLTVPQAPSMPRLSNKHPTSVDVSWDANGNGGAPITGFEVGYGTDPVNPTTIVAATSPKTITGLNPGLHYTFWVRAKNIVGFSPWSVSSNAQLAATVRIKVGSVWKTAVPYVRVGGIWKLAQPWVKTAGEWKETS